MKIPSRAFGFVRVGLQNSFGVRVPDFGTGGDYDNPLLNDVEAGDEAAGVEFVLVVPAQMSDGVLALRTDGGLSFTGAADGTYSQSTPLYVYTPGDAAPVRRYASGTTDPVLTIVVGSITSLDLDPATLALSGALSISGDIQIGASFDLAADPVALSGSLSVSGEIQSSTEPIIVARGRTSGGGLELFIDEAIEDDDEVIEIMQVLVAAGVLWEV